MSFIYSFFQNTYTAYIQPIIDLFKEDSLLSQESLNWLSGENLSEEQKNKIEEMKKFWDKRWNLEEQDSSKENSKNLFVI